MRTTAYNYNSISIVIGHKVENKFLIEKFLITKCVYYNSIICFARQKHLQYRPFVTQPNFSCKKIIRIRTFARIRTNFVLKFVHEIREKFVHESICLKITFLRKRYGEVSLPEIFQCRVLSAWADTEIC